MCHFNQTDFIESLQKQGLEIYSIFNNVFQIAQLFLNLWNINGFKIDVYLIMIELRTQNKKKNG